LKDTILFDLGGTLAHYFERAQFPEVHRQFIHRIHEELLERDLLDVTPETMWRRARGLYASPSGGSITVCKGHTCEGDACILSEALGGEDYGYCSGEFSESVSSEDW
jgi:hypothetical protein